MLKVWPFLTCPAVTRRSGNIFASYSLKYFLCDFCACKIWRICVRWCPLRCWSCSPLHIISDLGPLKWSYWGLTGTSAPLPPESHGDTGDWLQDEITEIWEQDTDGELGDGPGMIINTEESSSALLWPILLSVNISGLVKADILLRSFRPGTAASQLK